MLPVALIKGLGQPGPPAKALVEAGQNRLDLTPRTGAAGLRSACFGRGSQALAGAGIPIPGQQFAQAAQAAIRAPQKRAKTNCQDGPGEKAG